eukprot:1845397-Pyramimonas_sp.AAC.1
MFHTFRPAGRGWRCPMCAKYFGAYKQRKIFVRRICPSKISLRGRIWKSIGPDPDVSQDVSGVTAHPSAEVLPVDAPRVRSLSRISRGQSA